MSQYSSLRLYEIPAAVRRLDDEVIAADGELSADLEARLDSLDININEKFDAIAALIREREARQATLKGEADRLAAAAAVEGRVADRLKAYALATLEAMGRDKVDGARFCVRSQRNGRPSISWAGPMSELPLSFLRVVESLDGDAAYRAHKAGTLPDGFLVVTGKHLRIS